MRKARVLVVDDDPHMLHAIERVLASRYVVEAHTRPADALAAAAAFRPDVAVLDVRMPEMDGFALLEALRRVQPDIDALLITGSASESDAKLVRAMRDGAFYFLTKPVDREVLLTLLERCLELRFLQQAQARERERARRELAAARAFHRGLLPAAGATVAGVALSARCEPGADAGGDLYDWCPTPTGVTALIADVSGHDLPATMLTGTVKSAFRAVAAEDDAAAVCFAVLEAIGPIAQGRYVTLACARIHAGEGMLEYASAGHPDALLCRDGRVSRLASTGPLLSLDWPLPFSWNTVRVPFAGDDVLLLLSDGALETRGEGGADFGLAPLQRLLEQGVRGDALIARAFEELEAYRRERPREDDVTLVALTRQGPRRPPARS